MILILFLMLLVSLLPYILYYLGTALILATVILILASIGAASPLLLKFSRYQKIHNQLRNMCTLSNLERLDIKQKKKLAELVDLYKTNRKEFVKKWKSVAIYAATGYTVAKLGIDKTIRYGLGYVLIRKLLHKKTDDIF